MSVRAIGSAIVSRAYTRAKALCSTAFPGLCSFVTQRFELWSGLMCLIDSDCVAVSVGFRISQVQSETRRSCRWSAASIPGRPEGIGMPRVSRSFWDFPWGATKRVDSMWRPWPVLRASGKDATVRAYHGDIYIYIIYIYYLYYLS